MKELAASFFLFFAISIHPNFCAGLECKKGTAHRGPNNYTAEDIYKDSTCPADAKYCNAATFSSYGVKSWSQAKVIGASLGTRGQVPGSSLGVKSLKLRSQVWSRRGKVVKASESSPVDRWSSLKLESSPGWIVGTKSKLEQVGRR
uniref:Lysozyme n=1 Tax=Globodera pallida TaxID=36090 RepID=A0A183BUB9_GLOPA